MRSPYVLFRADASPLMGGGHVLRCLALADALRGQGARTCFAFASMMPWLEEQLRRRGHDLFQLPAAPFEAPLDGSWDAAILGDDLQALDAAATLAAAGAPDLAVLDHYRLDARWSGPLRAAGARLMVIDDLANRPHDCDVLTDQTLGRAGSDYAHLVQPKCRLLLGAGYAMLRPEFAEARPRALRRRREAPGRRILVMLGSTDIGGRTREVVSRLIGGVEEAEIDVVLGSRDTPSFGPIEALAAHEPRVRLWVAPSSMSDLLTAADVAIGAGGTASWERCCLSLPSVTLVIADNQKLVAERLAEVGASVTATDPQAAAARALQLIASPGQLQLMSAAAAALVDGKGVDRLARILLAPCDAAPEPAEPELCEASEQDSESIWLWRNDPVMRAMARSTDPISWPQHDAWFRRCMDDPDCLLLMGRSRGRRIGMVRFDVGSGEAPIRVSINLAPMERGAGWGGKLLGAGCAAAFARFGPRTLRADVRTANPASRRIFEANGFVPLPPAAELAEFEEFMLAPPG